MGWERGQGEEKSELDWSRSPVGLPLQAEMSLVLKALPCPFQPRVAQDQ